ncbi:MAG: sialidase family protein [Caldilineaceae bacterium]|nr:sialidase family protein [Caldilineaceae bacterium]
MTQITLGEPVLIDQAPVGLREWGPWQFPHLERLADGRIHLEFHVEADSVTAYGLPTRHALSADDGRTWEQVDVRDARGGLLLPNGDRLLPVQFQSRHRAEVTLPEPVLVQEDAPNNITHIYRAADFPAELSGWRFLRQRSGEKDWVEETASVRMPGEIRIVREEMYAFWPSFHHGRSQLAPDGSIWEAIHTKRIVDGVVQPANNIVYLRSVDAGYSWDILSEILYQPDREADPHADQRDGFTEPEFNFMPDGSVLCLLRTHDLLGVGPSYWSRSLDGGQSWSVPRVFDDRGVWPRMLTLGNGITLASYGRPGLFVRATADPAGLEWEQRVVVVEPAERRQDTCSYSAVLALDEKTALLAYSDFNYPDAQGQKRKSIMVRTVTVT